MEPMSEDKGISEYISISDDESNNRGCGSNGNETDWFSEIEEEVRSGWDTEELSEINESECSSLIDVDLDLDAAVPNEIIVHVGAGNLNLPCAEIYDSSCFKHLMLYHNAFKNFIEIPPKSLQAANKQNMTANRIGEMVIDVPNGIYISQLRLTEVLYSPEVGYILVSIGWLNKKGFDITFSGGQCTIKGPNGEHVGAVSRTRGLYCVTHDEPEMAHAADEELTLDQFHHCISTS